MTIDGDMLLKGLTLVFSVGTAFYAWVMSQGKAHEPRLKDLDERCAKLADKLQAAEARVSTLEGELTHLPDKDMVHRLELSLKDMQAQINGQGEVVKAVERTMQRVEAFLLDAQNRPVQAATARKR